MRARFHVAAWLTAGTFLTSAITGCTRSDPEATNASSSEAAATERWSHQDWPTGHYRVVEGWPKPLPDTRHSHDGWTWGSFGGVYRSEEHTSELQSRLHLVCRLLLEKKKPSRPPSPSRTWAPMSDGSACWASLAWPWGWTSRASRPDTAHRRPRRMPAVSSHRPRRWR